MLHVLQVKQLLCQACPAPRINSAMKTYENGIKQRDNNIQTLSKLIYAKKILKILNIFTDLSHLGQTSAPPHLGNFLAVFAAPFTPFVVPLLFAALFSFPFGGDTVLFGATYAMA